MFFFLTRRSNLKEMQLRNALVFNIWQFYFNQIYVFKTLYVLSELALSHKYNKKTQTNVSYKKINKIYLWTISDLIGKKLNGATSAAAAASLQLSLTAAWLINAVNIPDPLPDTLDVTRKTANRRIRSLLPGEFHVAFRRKQLLDFPIFTRKLLNLNLIFMLFCPKRRLKSFRNKTQNK